MYYLYEKFPSNALWVMGLQSFVFLLFGIGVTIPIPRAFGNLQVSIHVF